MTGSESSSTQSTGKGQSSLQQKQQNCKIKPSLEQKERECESESSLQQECPSKQQECKSENNLQQLKREPTLQQEYKRGQILSSSDDLRRMAIKNCSRESIKKSLLSPESLSTIPRKALPVSRTSTTPLKSTPAVECSTFKSKIPLNFIDKWPGSSASKTVPYRSQHEVLRRTYSNSVSGMHMTPTICNGSSSYIYHTPRNIRRNYRPRAPLNRITASSTPLGYRSTEYDMYGDDDDDDEDETKSMVELHHSRPLSPDDDLESSLQRGTGCMTPPCRNSLSLHMPLLGMESHTSSHRNHNQYEFWHASNSRQAHASHLPEPTDLKISKSTPHSQSFLSIQQYNHHHYQVHNTPQHPVLPVSTIPISPHLRRKNPNILYSTSAKTVPILRHIVMPTDKKVKLHVPQGRKTASLV